MEGGIGIPEIILILTFISILILVSLEKLEKAIGGLLGGIIAFIVFLTIEAFELPDILEFIDFQVILTILGIFTSTEVIRSSGFFQWIGIKGIKATHGRPHFLFLLLCLVAGLIAGPITAIAAMIVVGNLTVDVAEILDINPVPYLISEAITANVGALLSPIASIPNILIWGEIEQVSFTFFAINLLSFSLLLLPLSIYFLIKRVGDLQKPSTDRRDFLMEFNPWIVVGDRRLFMEAATLFIAMVASFIVLPTLFPQIKLWFVAIVFMIIFLALPETDSHELLGELDWETVFFIIGLFIMVEGLAHRGVLQIVALQMQTFLGGNYFLSILVILWFSGLASGVIDDIAVTVVLIPIVIQLLGPDSPLHLISVIIITTLIVGVNVGGNLTPMASPTTVLAMSVSKKSHYELTPGGFFKIGFFITLIQLVISTVYLISSFVLTHYYGVSMLIINIITIFFAILMYGVLYFKNKVQQKLFDVLNRLFYPFSKPKSGDKGKNT